jgi:hypothetical protein
MTEAEQQELAKILAEMGYDRASRTWETPAADRASLSMLAIGAACIVGAYLIATVIPGPPLLPISLTPFYLGVALAARLKSGWYAFALTLPAIYLEAGVAHLPWLCLSVAALAVIASVSRRQGDAPGRPPGFQAPSLPLPPSPHAELPVAPYGSALRA